jgi:hypothetical protein
MTEHIVNMPSYNQGGQYLNTPVSGSSEDTMYPEMTTFDLREWFEWVMLGNFEDPGIARPAIYRKLTNTQCTCFDKLTGSPDPNCVYCQGEGYLFTEQQVMVYFAKNFGSVLGSSTQIGQQSQLTGYGVSDDNRALGFMFWYDIPDYERYSIPTRPAPDKLFELKTGPDGGLDPNIIRTEDWRIRSLTAHHGDNSRVEYFELGLEKVSV